MLIAKKDSKEDSQKLKEHDETSDISEILDRENI